MIYFIIGLQFWVFYAVDTEFAKINWRNLGIAILIILLWPAFIAVGLKNME